LPNGNLSFNIINSAASVMPLKPFDVKLYYTKDLACRFFNPLNMPPDEIVFATAQKDGDKVVFERLLTGYPYTAVGVAYGPNGQIAAKACIDQIETMPDTTTELDLIFQLIPLNPVGTYRVRSYFDFGDAIAGTGAVGEWLVRIFDGFDNPGKLLYDLILDDVCSAFIPGILCDAIDLISGVTGLRDDIQNFITDLVMSSKTGCSIVRAGCDVRGTIRTLEVLSTLYMSKLGADFRILGTTNFTGLAFYWRFNCTINDPPDCGRLELDYSAMLDLQLVSGDWEGTVTGYDKLVIGNHGVDLRYGKLIVYIINQVILPAIAGGATTFQAALEHWFNCDAFANWLSGIELFGASLSYDASYGVCSGALGLLGNLLGFGTALLSLQEFSSVMNMNGEVTFVENTGDFLVDELVKGTWAGTLSFGSGTSAITGVWTGCRIGENGTCDFPELTHSPVQGSNTCRCDANCNCN
jgi:hypothetical protein